MNRALVTGASGFIGQHLIRRLLATQTFVRALSRSGSGARASGSIDFFRADLTDPESLSGACTQIDVIYHLAGHAHASDQDSPRSALLHHQITVEGTRALLSSAEAAGVRRFVFLSSVKAMGEGGDICQDETDPTTPASHYGRSKLEAENLVLEVGRRIGMRTAVLRLPLVYGSGVKGNLRQMMSAIDRGRFPPLPECGNKRSLVHVDDVVQALLAAAERKVADGQTYLVTDGRTYSTREIYEAICRELGRRVPGWSVPRWILRLGARVGDVIGSSSGRRMPLNTATLEKLFGSAWYSSDKISRELGYVPSHSLYDALPEMVAEYRSGVAGTGLTTSRN